MCTNFWGQMKVLISFMPPIFLSVLVELRWLLKKITISEVSVQRFHFCILNFAVC